MDSFEAAVQLRANTPLMRLLEKLMIRPLPFRRLHEEGSPTRRLLNAALAAGHVRRIHSEYALTRMGARTLLQAHEIVPVMQSYEAWKLGFRMRRLKR